MDSGGASGLHPGAFGNTRGRGLGERKPSCIHFRGLFDMAHIEALVVLLGIVFFAVKGLSDPFFGLLGLVAVNEIQPGELYPVLAPLHLERVLAILVLISVIAQGRKLKFPPITRWFLAFYGAMLIAIPLAFWRSNSILACMAFFSVVFYHVMLVSMLETEEQIRRIVLLFVALTAWLGGSAVYEYHAGIRQFAMGIDRAEGVTSSGGDPNSLAITMVVTMPLMCLLFLHGKSLAIRLFSLASFAIALVTIITTGSRTAFLAFILLMLMMVFRRPKNLKFLPLLVLAAPLFWMAIPQQYKVRYESIRQRDDDESYTNRLLSWQGGEQMFLHNPLTGVGPNNYADANGMRYWPGTPRHWLNAHSLYFKVLGELGIFGIITFGGYVICFFRLNLGLSRRLRTETTSKFLQEFPGFCNLSIILLLFDGYSAHDLYRAHWYTFGALSGAIALLPLKASASSAEIAEPTRKLDPWLPQAAPGRIAGAASGSTVEAPMLLGPAQPLS
jgi:O-antigen ligase